VNFRRAVRRDEPEINFIPLIDVLLVILIFLMVTTTYSRIAELQVSLPTGGAERPADPPPEISITVSADNRYALDGQVVSFVSASSFANQLRQRAGARKDAVIVISADAGATHQSVVNVLEAARQAGLPKVSFAAQSGARQ
jgi:biopolymer transport protein ExbD